MNGSQTRRLVAAGLAAATVFALVVAGARRQPIGQPSATGGAFAGAITIGPGRELYLRCAGSGPMTVVLEAGAHDSSDTWTVSDSTAAPVFEGVAAYSHVCMYDRPGTVRYVDPPALTARSSPAIQPRSLDGMASDLAALLTNAGIAGPYVLVGHSLGGLIVHLYAQRHPAEVAGIVFVDALAPDIKQLFGPLWNQYAQAINYPGQALRDLYTSQWETIDADGAIAAIAAAPAMPVVPTAVLSNGDGFPDSAGLSTELTARLNQVWPSAQQSLVRPGSDTPHTTAAGSGHNVHQSAPDLVTATIRLILDRARSAQVLPTTGSTG